MLACTSTKTDVERNQPKVILILADDLGFGDISLAHNPYLNTPNLDHLAKKSVHFTNFYVSPVCAPTRASLLTGRYHQRTGVQSVTNGYETLDPDEITLAEMLQQNGYHTGLFGKWHLGEYFPSLPNAQGFDEFVGFRTGHTGEYFDAMLEKNGNNHQTSGYITDVLTQEAWAFIKQNIEWPFFCYLAYNAPHTPLIIDSIWFKKYLPDSTLSERTARVYGLIENLDYNIGVLLDSLQKNQLLDNSIIIFMSDNGPISGWQISQDKMRFNGGLRDQKFTTYEGGIRTHCFWYWQNHWQPRVEREVIAAHIDVLPTIRDLLQINDAMPKPLDGVSLRLTLAGQKKTSDRIFYQKYALGTFDSHSAQPGGMARKGNWKMVFGKELYNLAEDPGEKENLAEKHPDILRQLNLDYESWWSSILRSHKLNRAPIPVGHREDPVVQLQPHHGKAEGHLTFEGRRGLTGEKIGVHPQGVDGDWLASWMDTTDQVSWIIDVQEKGKYQFVVEAKYSDLLESPHLQITCNNFHISASLESHENSTGWQQFPVGEMELAKGLSTVTLRLSSSLPNKALEVKSLSITRI